MGKPMTMSKPLSQP